MKGAMMLGGAALALAATPALAGEKGERSRRVQVKVQGSWATPGGKGGGGVRLDRPSLPPSIRRRSGEKVKPTLSAEYFATDRLSLEATAGITQHAVIATAPAAAGGVLLADARLIPATLTAKVHFDIGRVRPYLGAGPAWFLWVRTRGAAPAGPPGPVRASLTNEIGVALQAGLDVPVGAGGWGLSLDAKRYVVGTTARWHADGALTGEMRRGLDPLVLSAGVSYRF